MLDTMTELIHKKEILAISLEISTRASMEKARRDFIKSKTDNSDTHVMEVATKVEAKLFCDRH